MSVIQSIRDKGAWIVFGIIALALIAFILQDASIGRGSIFGNKTSVGSVNGDEIDQKDYEARMDLINTMNGGQIPREQLVPNVWNMMVEEKVLHQQYDNLGIKFTSKELNEVLFGANPPQWMQQSFTDPNTGVYDAAKARQQFAEMKKRPNDPQVQQVWDVYIQPTIDQSLRAKYQTLITQAIYIPKWMAEKNETDNNAIANVSYVYTPYTSLPDTGFTVSDDEIRTYMKKNAKEFETKEETRSISYVSFNASPSREDSLAAYRQVYDLKPEFESTSDVKAFLGTKGTEKPYEDAFVTSSNFSGPNSDVIKSLADGQTFGPYVDGTNYTVAKLVGRRTLPDSVKVRHILIKTGEGGVSDSLAKARIDSIQSAINGGANFAALVMQYSDDAGSKEKGGEYEFASSQFPGLSKEFAEVAFYGSKGEKKVVKVDNQAYSGYHYIEVMDQKNIQPAFKVAYLSKPILASQETVSTANSEAQKFAADVKDLKSFEAKAAAQKLSTLTASDIKEIDYNVGALGSSRELVRWVYSNEVGEISEPMEMGDRFIVAVITNINEPGIMSVQSARPMVEHFIRNEKKAKQILNKMKGNSLEAVAQASGMQVQRADSLSFSGFFPNVGNEPKVQGAAFNKNLQNKVSPAIAGATGVFVIRGEGIAAKASLSTDFNATRQSTVSNMKGQVGYRSMDALRKSAKVKDNRRNFY